MIRSHPLSAAAALLVAAGSSLAQDGPTTTLPTVTVTAAAEGGSLTVPTIEEARTELAAQPGGTAVVDAEEVRRGRATTVKDALDFSPVVYVQPRFGAEESRISIRGSGLQRTFHGRGLKLMQDGVPLNLADGSFDFQAVEPLSTRYIEIYRGANALEFAATTLGGAVNFVSFTGREASPLSARFEYGSFETYRGQVSSGQAFGAVDYYVSLSHFSQDGFRRHSQQNNQRIFANIGYRLNDEWETRFHLTYVQSDSELPGAISKSQLQDDPREAQRNPFSVPVDVVLSNWKRDFELFRIANETTWVRGDHRFSMSSFWSWKDLDHPILFRIDQLSNDFGLNLRYDNTADVLGHKNHFTAGIAPSWGVMQDNRFANNLGNRGAKFSDSEQTALNFDLYAQNRFYFAEHWALVLGAQASYAKRENEDHFPTSATDPDNSDEQDWWGFSPKAGVLCEITPDAQAFVNVSRSFEPPSFGELVNAANGGSGLVQLDAQTATTFEVGTRGRAARFAWDLAYYHAWLEDELLGFEVQPGFVQTVNAGRSIHQGFEAALDVELLRNLFAAGNERCETTSDGKTVTHALSGDSGDRITLRQLYLWNDFHFDDDRQFGDNQLAGIPEHYYRAELTYQHPSGFYGGPNVEWVPKKYNVDFAETLFSDPYALLGLKVGYRRARGFAVFFEAKNLTDEKYAATTNVIVDARGLDSPQFFPGEGRSFFGGIEWKW